MEAVASTSSSPAVQAAGAAQRKARDISIDYLRTTLTLLVLAHHSSLAYTTFAHFDPIHVFNSTAPIVDSHRWAFLDYAENFNDVFFMSLMFFVSGLFVTPVLRRHGAFRFARDRALRLGLPFLVTTVLLMPIAYYPSWQLAGHSHGFLDFWLVLAQHGFVPGPAWFIWVLLAFDCLAVALFALMGAYLGKLEPALERLKSHPVIAALALIFLCGAAYLPLLARFGFGAWTAFLTPPLYFQVARIGLYLIWFVSGVMAGSAGLQRGLLARDGRLARSWPVWLAFCLIAYNALWFVPKLSLTQELTASARGGLEAILWVISNVASCLALLAIFRGVARTRRAWMDSLSRSAYVMYLVHYVFLTWSQNSLLNAPLHAGLKFVVVFVVTTTLSWITAQIVLRIPRLATIV